MRRKPKQRKQKTERQKYRDLLDKMCSLYIRKRDRFCQRCGGHDWKTIQWCHYIPRTLLSLRWDEDNACGLCSGCHRYLDTNSDMKEEFFLRRLGETKVTLLKARRRYSGKVDYDGWYLYLKTKLHEVGIDYES